MILIFANGEMETTAWVEPYLEEATLVLAADGGLRYLLALGRLPDILIGDLDSVAAETLDDLEASGVKVVRHERAKDETDLELALLYALQQDDDGPIFIVGAIGGRLDQTLANVFLLAHPALTGREVTILTEHQRAWLVRGSTRIAGRAGDRVSLLPIGGAVEIASTDGLEWSLTNETLVFGPARGVSNVMTAAEATICLKNGMLVCVHAAGTWVR